jgi:hypothetical protein
LKIAKENARQPLIDQYAAVLRIVGRLQNVEAPIFGLYQMGLCATAHLTD